MIFSKTLTLESISRAVGLNQSDIGSGVDFYNSDFSAYGNEIYREIYTRAAHWLNFQEQGWFSKRLSYYLDNYSDYDVIIDLGFSVPYAYARPDYQLSSSRFIFVDKYRSAVEFKSAIEGIYGGPFSGDSVIIGDIEQESTADQILNHVARTNCESVLVVGSEIVEHLSEPDLFWRVPERLSALGHQVDCFVTLPVGKQIPSHTVEFLSNGEAQAYLQRFLSLKHEGLLIPPPQERSPYLESCVWQLGRFGI